MYTRTQEFTTKDKRLRKVKYHCYFMGKYRRALLCIFKLRSDVSKKISHNVTQWNKL